MNTKTDAEDFARSFLAKQKQKGAEAVFFDRADKALLDQIRQICGDVNPLEAVKWWKVHWNPKMSENVTTQKAFDAFLQWLESAGRSRGHIRNVSSTGAKFCEAFGVRTPASLQSDEILQWILALPVAPKSKKNIRGDIASFFLWCKNAKGWVSVLPEIDARLLPRAVSASVDVWSADEAEAALRRIEREFPQCMACTVSRGFRGISRAGKEPRRSVEKIAAERQEERYPAHVCDDACELEP